MLSVFNGVRGREERRFEVFFERGAVEATTDFIVGASEDSFLVQRPDAAAERPDLEAMREEHFAALGLRRRDFVFYTYPADRHWVRLRARRDAGVARIRRRPPRPRTGRRRLPVSSLRSDGLVLTTASVSGMMHR